MLSISLCSKLVLLLLVFVSTTCGTEEADLTATYCDGSGWVPYLDEKCFKLIKRWATRDDAKNACAQELLQTDPSIPHLVSIKSLDEQNYLTKYVFDESAVKISVWLGAKRSLRNPNTFVWDDESEIGFTNWAEGSPTEKAEADCVEMQSEISRQFSNSSYDTNLRNRFKGNWRDVTCELPNYVICEKLQRWSFGKMQQSFLSTRKKLKDSLDSVAKELDVTNIKLSSTQSQLASTQNQLTNLQNNPVPIGFIYVQLPNQPEPKSLWPTVEWTIVSANYAGHFFRVEGGNAAPFAQSQSDAFQGHHHQFNYEELRIYAKGSEYVALWNNQVKTSNLLVKNPVSDGRNGEPRIANETRPINYSVRIWKRVS